MIPVHSPIEVLPRFFGHLPDSALQTLTNQMSQISYPLQLSLERLKDLFASFSNREYDTLLPLLGLDLSRSFGAWPLEARRALLPFLPEYLGSRGTKKSYEIAIQAILGVGPSAFTLLERTFPGTFAMTDDLMDQTLFLGRANEEAFSITIRFSCAASHLGSGRLETLNAFLKAELPVGIRHFMEFENE